MNNSNCHPSTPLRVTMISINILFIKNIFTTFLPNSIMLQTTKLIVVISLITTTLFSCVSKRKYLDAQVNLRYLRSDSMRLANENKQLEQKKQALNAQYTILQQQMDSASKDAQSKINLQQDQLSQREKMIAAQQKDLEALQTLINQQKEFTTQLRKKMTDALIKFKSDELTVSIKNGKVYVSLQESLLFKSGSAEVNPKGKEALASLALALNTNTDINVEIEGHTDSLPIKVRYEDNWALSVARSSSIVRILANEYAVNPIRIKASGRSQFEPLESNTTPEGRAKNRRTEIILSPKLDELYKLINN